METVLPPLAAMLAPMGPKAQEILISCLPDPLARAVNARLKRPEDGEEAATALERGLRAQAEEAWGGEEGSKFEVRSSKAGWTWPTRWR